MQEMIQTVAADPGVRNAVLFCSAAAVGQVLNAVMKWAEKETDCIIDWFRTNPRRTVAAIVGNIIGVITALTVAGVENLTIVQSLGAGVLLGLGADRVLNRAKRAEWDESKRAARTRKE